MNKMTMLKMYIEHLSTGMPMTEAVKIASQRFKVGIFTNKPHVHPHSPTGEARALEMSVVCLDVYAMRKDRTWGQRLASVLVRYPSTERRGRCG